MEEISEVYVQTDLSMSGNVSRMPGFESFA